MKRIVMAITLGCVLSVSALAGDIPSVPVAPPPPDEITASTAPTGTTSPGDLTTAGFAEEVSDAALSALMMVFAW